MFRCPKCKSDGPFEITGAIEVYQTVTVDGGSNVIDYSNSENHLSWQHDNEMTCNTDCGFEGKVLDFEIKALDCRLDCVLCKDAEYGHGCSCHTEKR